MDFFAAHSWLLLISLALFPRITMAFMAVYGTLMTGGILWWLGFIFLPGVVVAVEATTHYWTTNPVLCVLAWMIAFSSTSSEAKVASSSRNK